MKIISRISSFLFLLIVFLLPSMSHAQSGRSWMEGYVVGESDVSGLGQATVELAGDPDNARLKSVKLTAKTGEMGKYAIKEIPYGDYILRVSAPGYVTYQINIYILSDTLTQLHVRLKKEKSPD